MADFDKAIPWCLRHEDATLSGNIETDSNGAKVRFGVNQAANPNMPEGFFSGAMGRDDALSAAESVYRNDYWNPLCGDQIASQCVATKLLDMGINMGVGGASWLIQGTVNVTRDGVIGPTTLAAINDADENYVLARLVTASEIHYSSWAQGHPERYPYLKGLLARANDLPPAEEA